ncbi:MAG: hypothetical protein MZV70_42190 [Desulfobacterales bacterium]|nr:hypothetical protein [Desulfobacterales bacterium]
MSLSAILEAAGQLSRAKRAADVPGYSRVLVNGKDMLVWPSTGLGPLWLRRLLAGGRGLEEGTHAGEARCGNLATRGPGWGGQRGCSSGTAPSFSSLPRASP